MHLVLFTKMFLWNSMYMMKLIEFSSGALNSIFAPKVPFFSLSWGFPWQRRRCAESKNAISRFISSPRNIQTIIHIYWPCCCKWTSVSIYVLIISKQTGWGFDKTLQLKILCNFVEITLPRGYSSVDLLHIFPTLFLWNTSGKLLPSVTWH